MGEGGGVIRPRRCMGVWVYKAALLYWAGRTLPAESGRWIWWRRHQGWRRPGRPLHTAGISGHRWERTGAHMTRGRKRGECEQFYPCGYFCKLPTYWHRYPFYNFRWPLVCCLRVKVISLIIIKHQWVHTGSIWKCLIFWWWHNVSTNALGLLWLTLTRNNLCNKREGCVIKNRGTKALLDIYLHSVDRKTYPSTCPCWWMMRWDSSLVILPWNHSWAIWMTAERANMLKRGL